MVQSQLLCIDVLQVENREEKKKKYFFHVVHL